MISTKNWVKMIYKENNETVRCIQGCLTEKSDFFQVEGDNKTLLVNKHNVISIHACKAGDSDGKQP